MLSRYIQSSSDTKSRKCFLKMSRVGPVKVNHPYKAANHDSMPDASSYVSYMFTTQPPLLTISGRYLGASFAGDEFRFRLQNSCRREIIDLRGGHLPTLCTCRISVIITRKPKALRERDLCVNVLPHCRNTPPPRGCDKIIEPMRERTTEKQFKRSSPGICPPGRGG